MTKNQLISEYIKINYGDLNIKYHSELREIIWELVERKLRLRSKK